METKVSNATEQEKSNLINFFINRYKSDDPNIDEIDAYLQYKSHIVSITKIEIDFKEKKKIIFNVIQLYNSIIRDYYTKVLSDCVMYYSEFYEVKDDNFEDISNDDFLDFGKVNSVTSKK
jgi:hypothetical protein